MLRYGPGVIRALSKNFCNDISRQIDLSQHVYSTRDVVYLPKYGNQARPLFAFSRTNIHASRFARNFRLKNRSLSTNIVRFST